MINNLEGYSMVEIDAEVGEDWTDYMYEHNNKFVPQGTPIGVEITQNGNTTLFLYDGILFSSEARNH